MLYLEDYLEMIEHLPAELRDRFTEMREQDLSVQNRVDSLEERQKNFFSNCAKNKLKGSEKEEYESIRKEYQKVIEDASEKVQLAEDSYSLVDKYMRKLDQELLKFKLELEADNRGITEILEKHSLEMDQPGLGVGGSSLKENRHPKKHGRKLVHGHSISHHGGSTLAASTIAAAGGGIGAHGNSIKIDRKHSLPTSSVHTMLGRDLASTAASYLGHDSFTLDQVQPHIQTGSPLVGNISGSSGGGLGSGNVIGSGLHQQGNLNSGSGMGNTSGAGSYPLQHIGAGGSAIAAAASQAIAATQQLTGRRTASLKASFEAINLGVQTHEFRIGQEIAGAAQSALAASGIGPGSSGLSPGVSGHLTFQHGGDKIATAKPSSAGNSTPTISSASNKRNKKQSKASVASGHIGSTQHIQLDVGGLMDIDTGILDPSSFVMGGSNSPTTEELLSGGNRSGTGSGGTPEQEWYDPSEPRYCICNQVSYGDMVACDNEDCPYEWFHYPCVGIEAPPKGKWYCPTCTANMARRKGRK